MLLRFVCILLFIRHYFLGHRQTVADSKNIDIEICQNNQTASSINSNAEECTVEENTNCLDEPGIKHERPLTSETRYVNTVTPIEIISSFVTHSITWRMTETRSNPNFFVVIQGYTYYIFSHLLVLLLIYLL